MDVWDESGEPHRRLESINDASGSPFATTATDVTATSQRPPPPVRFYAMGDTPYNGRERRNLPRQIANMGQERPKASFVVHVGDMQEGRQQCVENRYAKVATSLAKSPYPLFIIPGDNDYYDCNNWKTGWGFWKKHFLGFHRQWKVPSPVRQQANQPENFAFTYRRVLFIGIHTTDTDRRKNDWNKRNNRNQSWTVNQMRNHGHRVDAVVIFSHAYTRKSKQRKYWIALSDEAERLGLPVLFLQGDTHQWKQWRPFRAKNILVTVVDRGGMADPVLVTVDPTQSNQNDVFSFQRRELTRAR